MPLSHAFRLSFYVSLAISCLTLFYGEWDFLPWMCALYPVMLGFMVYAYLREGHNYLNETIANRLGTTIGALTIVWIVYKIPRTEADLIAGGVPWPAAMVPLLAPLLPLLLLVKLYRPKSLADFWVFQTISLVIVTLACILAGELLFFVLLVVFLVSLLWCLTLFFLYRQKMRSDHPDLDARRVPLFGPKEAVDPMPTPLRTLGAGRALRWATPIVLLGLGLFFLLPRFSDSQWVPNKLAAANQVMMKAGGGTGVDLQREGVVELSDEPAFEVLAFNNEGKPVSLPANQRWRVEALDVYSRGKFEKWDPTSRREPLPNVEHLLTNEHHPSVPPKGMTDAQVYLCFQIDYKQTGGVPLADPIAAKTDVGLFPHFYVDGRFQSSQNPFVKLQVESGIFVSRAHSVSRQMYYGELFTPSWRGVQVPAFPVSARYLSHLSRPHALGTDVPESIEKWTRNLLPQLKGLTKEDIAADEHNLYRKDKHAKIAQALSNYLQRDSGLYSYSLRLKFLDRTEDPTADFLLNVREGHCERFAGGLTLMLHSLRIPARLVKGFQGYELLEPGRYLIKQNMAHAWVEALVPGAQEDSLVWLQLDPTPSNGDASESSLPFVNWMWTRLSNPQFMWKNLIMDYNNDRRTEASEQLGHMWDRLTDQGGAGNILVSLWETYRWLIVILGLAGTTWLTYLARRLYRRIGRARVAAPPLDFYRQLLRVLARRCHLQPTTGQTPLEFAQLACKNIAGLRQERTEPLPAMLTEVPIQAARLLYRVRFSGQPRIVEECVALEKQIAELDAALRG